MCGVVFANRGRPGTTARKRDTCIPVKILEKVFDTLLAKATMQLSPSDNTSEVTRASFANSFSSLTIEGTFHEDDSVDVPSPTEEAPPMPKVKYEVEYSRHEWLFEVYCFYPDFNGIRECIQDLWLDFKAHKIDLMVSYHTLDIPWLC